MEPHIQTTGDTKSDISEPVDKISMVIATYNRGHLLDQNFKRLCELTIPDEILVIDDGGTDETETVCRAYSDRLPIRYIYNKNPQHTICSFARNIGIKESQYEWIVTIEPELVLISDAIKQFKDAHENYPNDIISSGKIWFCPECWTPGDIGEAEQFEEAGDYQPAFGFQTAIGWVAPYTALWKKEWLVKLGGWDEGFPGPWGWDDIDLLTRLRIDGHGQYINLNVMALHLFHGLGGDVGQINERYWQAKSFNNTNEQDLSDLVSNKGKQWGIIQK